MSPINNYNVYISGMEKFMEDKLFWLDKIPKEDYSVVVDYGCANGAFLKKVRENNPDCFVCGIDIDDWMLNEARMKFDTNATFINEVYLSQPSHLQGDVLNLSSVIHEIYSYKQPAEIYNFWNYALGHKYICIRDMVYDWVSLNNYIPPILPVKDKEEYKRRKEFEAIWGSISKPKNFEHYMLKYRFVENWSKEVKENYLPLGYDSLIAMARMSGYEIIYSELYTLPFLKEKIKEDWGIDFTLPTHIKMIWKLEG